MAIEGDVVFGHLPKGGGTFIKKVLYSLFPNGGVHVFDEKDPVTSEALKQFTIGSIRNPCEWYVSFWAFVCQNYPHHLPRGEANCGPKTDSYDDHENIMKFREAHHPHNLSAEDWVPSEWPGMLSVSFAKKYSGKALKRWPRATNNPLQEDVIAIKQALRDFSPSAIDCWVHTESETSDMTECIQSYERRGGTVNWASYEKVRNHSTHNPSHHASCRSYFDKDTEAFVRAIDGDIFKMFRYDTCCK